MRPFLLPILAALLGCAHQPTVPDHLIAAERQLKGADVRHGQDVEWWSRAVADRVASCRAQALKTEEARRVCLGALGQGGEHRDDASALASAYDAIAEQIDVAQAAAARLELLYAAAREEAAK